MRLVLQPIRFLTIIVSLVIYVGHMSIVFLLVRDRWKRAFLANHILSYYCRWGLWVLNVKVRLKGSEHIEWKGGAFYVGNHLSYLDVLVICSRIPVCFITSQEIRQTPVLGLLTDMAGCLYVERRNKQNIMNEVREIAEGLQHKLSVVIFPEATSSNGEQIFRFRKGLYLAATQTGSPVVPFCQNYHHVGGKPINQKSRDSVFWYGDMSFAPHLWALCGSGGVEMDLIFMQAIPTQPESDAVQLAQQSQAAVEAVFMPVRS